ncbi:50S ribosomal protein L1 [bacterium]|nr:50S ribosomal protein L1 [bacterium]
MPKRSKRYLESVAMIDKQAKYSPVEAIELVKKLATAKFDETIEAAINLGVDPRHSDQMVRGTILYPYPAGSPPKVMVFAKGENAEKAKEAGADLVGDEELVNKIREGWKGWKNMDLVLATPDMMGVVSRLGRILGPRMPNPRAGTVSQDIAKTVRDFKEARLYEFRVDRSGIIHMPIGKVSQPTEQILQNLATLLSTLMKARPASFRGQYIKGITLSSTMGPGIKVDLQKSRELLEST